MRLYDIARRAKFLIAPGIIFLGLSTAQAEEPSRVARLFRLGGGGNSSAPAQKPGANLRPAPLPAASMPSTVLATPPSTPDVGVSGPAPRITPQPRNSKPPTEADPLVTRVAIGRSDNGGQFGMFLQVFADGTVIDSEGVHRVSPDALRPVTEALRMSEIYRQKGHCGGPATDFIEQVHMVVFERSYGKLKANAFSYSGNTHGCDPSVKHLHNALDGLQAKMAGSPTPTVAAPVAPTNQPSQRGGPILGLSPGR